MSSYGEVLAAGAPASGSGHNPLIVVFIVLVFVIVIATIAVRVFRKR